MTTTDLFTTPSPQASAQDVADRLVASVLGSVEVLAVYLGDRLGWYAALRDHGPLTSTELARRTGTVERYAREWLEHQAASGYLVVAAEDATTGSGATPGADAALTRRYRLRPAQPRCSPTRDSLLYTAPLARFVAAAGRVRPAARVLPARRRRQLGAAGSRRARGAGRREPAAVPPRPRPAPPPTVPELHARLPAGARVADVGCGDGWSAIGLARGVSRGHRATGSTSTSPSVVAPGGTPRRAGWRPGVVHARRRRRRRPPGGPYDVVPRSSACTTCPTRSPSCARCAASPATTATSWSWTSGPGEEFTRARPAPLERLLYGYCHPVCLPDGLSHRAERRAPAR